MLFQSLNAGLLVLLLTGTIGPACAQLSPIYCNTGDDNVVLTTTLFGQKLCVNLKGNVTNQGRIFLVPEDQIFRSFIPLSGSDFAALSQSTGKNLLIYKHGESASYALQIPGCHAPVSEPNVPQQPLSEVVTAGTGSRIPPAASPCLIQTPTFLTVAAGDNLYVLNEGGTIETVDGTGAIVRGLNVNLGGQVIAGSSSSLYISTQAIAMGRKSLYGLQRYDLNTKELRTIYGPTVEPITAVIVMPQP